MSQTCQSMRAKAQGAIAVPPRPGQQTHSSQITKSSLIVLRKAEKEFKNVPLLSGGKNVCALSANLANGN